MKTRSILIIVSFFTTMSVSLAQKSEVRLFGAHLHEGASKEAVQFGAIKNIRTGEVTLSNETGYFEINGSVGDTLHFHSLGYRDTTWVIPGIWFTMEQAIQLKVQANIYALSEVNVVRYYSYAHFKQAFKDLKLEKTEREKAKEKIDTWQNNMVDAIAWGKSDAKLASGTFGVSLSMGTKDKIVTQRKEVDRLLDIQDKSKRFNYFVSRDNISRLTDYKGTCLDSFMVFLNTSYHLHYQMQEYELLSSILKASANYRDLKGEEEWFILPTD